MCVPDPIGNVFSDLNNVYSFIINKKSDVKALSNQIIKYRSDQSTVREEKINMLIQKVIQGDNSRCRSDDVICLREITHLLGDEKALRLDIKLKSIFLDVPRDKNDIYMDIIEQGWNTHWTEYHEFIDLLHPDEASLHLVSEQLFSLDRQSRQLLKEIISEMPQERRLPLFDRCFQIFFGCQIDLNKFEVTKLNMGTPDEQKLEILHILKTIPANDRVDAIEHVSSFDIEKMNWHRRGVILSVISKIPKDDRADLIRDAKSFFCDAMACFYKIEILKAFQEITKDDRADVIHHAIAMGIGEVIYREERSGIITTLAKIVKDERSDIVEHSKCFIEVMKGIDTGEGDVIELFFNFDRVVITYLLKTMKGISKEERSDAIEHTKSLLKNRMSRTDTVRVLSAIGKAPKSDRADIVRHVKFLDIGELKMTEEEVFRFIPMLLMKGNGISRAVEILTILPEGERELLAQSFKPLMAVMSKPCLNDMAFALLLFYLLPDHLKTERRLEALDGKLLDNAEYREAIIASLKYRLSDLTINLSNLANFVYSNSASLQLHEEHPVLQEAIEVISASSIKGEKNPFTIYRKLKELKKEPSTFEPKPQTIEDITVAINMKRLTQVSSKIELRRQCLNPEVTLEAWNRLREGLKARVEGDEELKEALKTYGTTWDAIWELSLSSQYLSGLLALSEETVSLSEAKFRAVLSNLLTKDTCPRQQSPFTEQEEVLIKTAMMIHSCPGGQQEGIDLIYSQLPPEYQYRVNLPISSQEEDKKDCIHRFVEEVVKRFISFQFWGDNLPIMQELTGEKDIKQGSHQSIYVKNMVSHLLGLDHELIFDQNAGVLSDSLIAKSRDEVLEIIFTHVTPEKLAQELIRVVNSDLHKNSRIVFPLIEADEYWDTPDDLLLTLNMKGAIKLLQETEYFT